MKNDELEVNNKLPNGWAYAGLEDISDVDRHSIKRGPFGSALKKEFFVHDGYKVYEQGNVINNDFDRGTYFINDKKFEDLKSFSIKPKDILMSCAGTVGKLAIVPDGVKAGVINQALLKLSVHPDIDLQYFFKLFTYQIDEILKSNLRGSAMMNLTSVKDLKLVKFPIAPINEQKRIVAKIEKLFSNLDNSDKYLLHLEKQLKRYRQSVLKSAFEGELTKEWRQENKIKKSISFKFISEIANTTSGGTPSRTKKEYWGGNINWLKSGELRDNYIEFVEEKISDEGLKNSSAKIFPSGTLLMAMYGATIGRLGILNVDTSTNQAVCAIKNTDNAFVTRYLFFYLMSIRQKMIEESFGGAQPNLSQGYINNIEVPICSIAEQQEIVNQIEKHFSIIDKLQIVVQQSIKESKRLRQSILKQAFEGKLVEQDPNDESASLLLEKIAKEKEEYLKVQKNKQGKNKYE